MEIYQLRYFVEIAKHENLSRAAKSLNVSQPSLSKSIQKLEKELGVELVERNGKALQLNDKGKILLSHAEKVLRELNAATNKIRGTTSNAGGRLVVGIFGQQTLAAECLTSFMEMNPNVELTIDARRKTSTEKILNEYDLIFYPESDTFLGMQGRAYASSKLSIGVSSAHPLANIDAPIRLDAFKDDPFIFMNTAAGSYESSYRLCQQYGFDPKVRAVTSSGLVQAMLISKNLGIGFLTDDACQFSSDSIRRLELEENLSKQTLCFASRAKEKLSPLAQDLLRFTCQYFDCRY